MSGKIKGATPVRNVLRPDSVLQNEIQNGLGALKDGHRAYIDQAIRSSFSDSLEVDQNLKHGREGENRWDYLLGHAPTAIVVGLEPHSARDDQVSTVIRKRKRALDQLTPHLKDGVKISEWFWVASGRNHFSDTEKSRRLLDQSGIKFVCPTLGAKHMEKLIK